MMSNIRHWITLCEASIGRRYDEVLYHGTDHDFTEFQISGTKLPALGVGYYFTPSLAKAKQYGKIIIKARIVCSKLLDWDALTDEDRQNVIDAILPDVPAEKIAGYGAEVGRVFTPDQTQQASEFYWAKREATKDLYHDRAKAKLSQNDDGNFVVSWMEPSLENASNHDLNALVEYYHNNLARDVGYDGAKFGDEVVVFDSKQITILTKEVIREAAKHILPVTPENIAAAKQFVFAKWKERASEMGHDEPVDLTSACKFASLFAAEVFGGQVRGNFFHQWVELPNGQALDLNDEAEDVATMLRGEIPDDTKDYAELSRKRLPSPLYTHDQRHMRTRDNRDSMASIRPRVMTWVAAFLHDRSGITESIRAYHGTSSNAGFAISHTGDNSHTFGASQSERWGTFFTDNPVFAAMYGRVSEYELNIKNSAVLKNVIHPFIDTLDPFDPTERPIFLAAKYLRHEWQWFEGDVGQYFTQFLQKLGYDSVRFTEYNEDDDGNDQKSETIVVLDPSLINRIATSVNEVAIAPTQSVQWDSRSEKLWTGSFQVGDRPIEIIFARLNSFGATRWRVDFRKGKHQPTRGTVAETTSILNGVVGAIGEFLDSVKPDRLEMSPTNASREKLYRAVIKRMMPQISQAYKVEEKSYGTLFGEFVLSKNEQIIQEMPVRNWQTIGNFDQDPEFKTWFGQSKIVRDGQPMMVFHQTGVDNAVSIETHGFDIERLGARASDDTMPDGIFFKPTTDDIGVGGKKTVQMPFFLSIRNPLRVRDREALRIFLYKDKSYRQFADKVHAVDTQLAKAYEKLMDRHPPQHGAQHTSDLKPMASTEVWDAASAKLNIQCDRYLNKVATVARARATAVIKAHGYDGLWMDADKGGGLFGNRFAPTTIIAFSKSQVRSAKAERQAEIDRSWGR